MHATEGTIPYRGYETWYRIVGDGEAPGKLPLLCLHGGPGAAHDYLESLERVAETGRRAIFYDQAGRGNPSRTDEQPWNVETFVARGGAAPKQLGRRRQHNSAHALGGLQARGIAA